MKNDEELNRLLLKFVLSCLRHSTSYEYLGKQKILEKAFFRLSKSLKSKILATMVPPPGYTGFIITNFPFEATQRLERMSEHRKFEYFSQPWWDIQVCDKI